MKTINLPGMAWFLPMSCELLLLGMFGLSSCSGVKVVSNLDSSMDAKVRGIRHLGTSPYLIAYTDNAGGVTVDLEYISDPNKLNSAQPFAYLAKTEGKFSFTNGVLGTFEDASDSTDIPKAVIAAGQEILTAAMEAGRFALDKGVSQAPAETQQLPQHAPRVAIFKFLRHADGSWILVGEDGAIMKVL